MEADDESGDHARRPAMTKPSLRPSCLGARWQARPLAQERSAKALDVWQQHGERDHGGRAPGPSRRSPQASSSSSARSCRSSVAAGQRSPRSRLVRAQEEPDGRSRACGHESRARDRATREPDAQRRYKLRVITKSYAIKSALRSKKLWPVLLRFSCNGNW